MYHGLPLQELWTETPRQHTGTPSPSGPLNPSKWLPINPLAVRKVGQSYGDSAQSKAGTGVPSNSLSGSWPINHP